MTASPAPRCTACAPRRSPRSSSCSSSGAMSIARIASSRTAAATPARCGSRRRPSDAFWLLTAWFTLPTSPVRSERKPFPEWADCGELDLDLRLRAPRGALDRAVMKGHRPWLVAASRVKLGAAYPVETDGYGWQAAPTTTGRASTVRWSGSGKRDGKVYVRNQRSNAPQENPPARNLADLGWAAARTRIMVVRGTPGPVSVVGREATRKACGVLVARLQGHSWSPNPTNGPE